MFQTAYKNSSIDWKPSPILALVTNANSSQVAAARQDGSLEIWLVSPGSVGWHCQVTIQGDPNSRISSLVWLPPTSENSNGKLLSSGIDGSVSEWDFFNLNQKKLLESSGITIWQMALAPLIIPQSNGSIKAVSIDEDFDSSDSDSEEATTSNSQLLAIACDDGCVRMYNAYEPDQLEYVKSMPRVSGRMLSVTWSSDGTLLFAGSSDGLIRCWNANHSQELYRITVAHDSCIWSLLFLRCGTLVSADSTGSVRFWDSNHGTLLQSYSCHAGDVNALAAAPSNRRVFSAGADGQVIMYKLVNEEGDEMGSATPSVKKWVLVSNVRAHTHDIKALTIAVPITTNDRLSDEKVKQPRRKKIIGESTFHKWANMGVPMVISGGDDTKLFAYSVKEFTKFSPHDICPAPQRVPMQLIRNSDSYQFLLVQSPFSLDIFNVRVKKPGSSESTPGPSKGHASTDLIARVKTKSSRKIICSCISSNGQYFAYSDISKVSLFELRKREFEKLWTVNKLRVFHNLPSAHCMVFASDSSSLILAAHDRKIHIIDVAEGTLSHTFHPSSNKIDGVDCNEPPITKMFASHDAQWLAASNSFGDVYVFNLETLRPHWFMARLDGAAITAGGFPPENGNVLVVTTSSNKVYALDVEKKRLGDWSMRHTCRVPQRFQDFPGEVIGLSFVSSSRVIVYSARAMCMIDFGMGVEKDEVAAYHSPIRKMVNGGIKRKMDDGKSRRNFEIVGLRDPVLFIGNLWDSLLIIDKPWIHVLTNLDSAPLHRHLYGS